MLVIRSHFRGELELQVSMAESHQSPVDLGTNAGGDRMCPRRHYKSIHPVVDRHRYTPNTCLPHCHTVKLTAVIGTIFRYPMLSPT